MLSIRAFGSLEVAQGGERTALPQSRKTRALLAYLAISGAPQRRDRLCELFWEVPDDPRGALRWSLSKLRPIVNVGGVERLEADRERVRLSLETVNVDFLDVRLTANTEEASRDALATAWRQANELLLADCELSNQPAYTAWLERQRAEAQRFRARLARRLALLNEAEPEAADQWSERWLADAPFDPLAARFTVACRRRSGRAHEADALVEELTESFREAGRDAPVWSDDPFAGKSFKTAVANVSDAAPTPRQSVRFVQAADDTSLAWASVGSPNSPPLVKAANWLSHLELDWEAPIWSPLFRDLGTSFNFIRYDERGCGLSDWDVDDISFESWVSDLKLVADAAGLERFPLLGISQGAAVCIEFAVRYPERVSQLILFGGYSAGWRHVGDPDEIREREAIMTLTASGWGRSNPSYRHLFSQTFMPDATAEELAWFDEFQRRTTSPENAVRFLDVFSKIDVRDRLKDVQAPTLVIHSRNDQRIPFETGRELAAQMPQAEFVGLDSANHLLLGREPASGDFLKAVRRFLQVT